MTTIIKGYFPLMVEVFNFAMKNFIPATQSAITKWQGIRDGRISIREGIRPCELCRAAKGVRDLADPKSLVCCYCPLSQYGYGCLESNSVWSEFGNLEKIHEIDPFPLDRFRPVCDQMLTNLHKVLVALMAEQEKNADKLITTDEHGKNHTLH